MKRKLVTITSLVALAACVFAAQAQAHGFRHGWGHGYWGHNAVVTGTVTSVGNSSFGASAYVITPGAGGSSTTPATTAVTINEGPDTKVVVLGQSGLQIGDTFYATYRGQSSTTPITTLVSGDASKVFAFVPPTPEVKVSGIITAAPTTGDPDQFTATAYIVTPIEGGGPWHPPVMGGGPVFGGQYGGQGDDQGGGDGSGNSWGQGYSYGGQIGGSYGFRGFTRQARHSQSSPTGTPGTVITVDSSTTFDVNANTSATVGDLADGQVFTAVFDGTPDETLAQIVSNPALSITARTPHSLYAFVGTVTATSTTSTPETISVNVAQSTPSGLFTGVDTFDIGPDTFVFGGPNGSLFGSLSDVSVGDVVAGGVISSAGQSASAIESDPLQVLVDFPVTASPGTSTTAGSTLSAAQQRRVRAADYRKALKLLGKDQKSGKKHHKKRHG